MSLAKIKITVSSTVKNEGDPLPENSKDVFLGVMKYSERSGVEHIIYKSESDGAKVETVIEPRGDVIRLVRSGAIESEMIFEAGVTHSSLYNLPPFSFDMTLTAKRTECSLSALGGVLTLEYTMTVGGAKKDCLMKITVTPC